MSKKLSLKIESKNITTKYPENTNCQPCVLDKSGVCTRHSCPKNFILRDGMPSQPIIRMSTVEIDHPNNFDPVVRG